MSEEIRCLIWKMTLFNAIQHDGSARAESIFGKVLAERPDLKVKVKELSPLVNSVVGEVNALPLFEQKRLLTEKWPEMLTGEKAKAEEKRLPPLPNVDRFQSIHVRFCPNPDGALHLGSSRAAILCDEYAKMYKGRFTLRFDDSDPRTKSPILEAYDWIREDLRWLDIKWHDEVCQSDRLEIYYDYAVRLIEMGKAYICTCNIEAFRKLVIAGNDCPCRSLRPEEHSERWTRMFSGFYKEGDAVVRIKTDLSHPNPAVREWPALRIIDVEKFPHPRVGDKYRVWPLFAFCCGIDDHDFEISHVLRGKEHLTNSVRQSFLYKYFRWSYPEAIHYGRLNMVGTVLSKSKIREGLKKKIYSGWDDPRLGTLIALRRRGFLPATIRQLIVDVGPKAVDVTVSWDNLQAYNRKILDPMANRYFFVSDPVQLTVTGVDRVFVCNQPLHPSFPERGSRVLSVVPENGRVTLLISRSDLRLLEVGKLIRLMGLFNVIILKVEADMEAKFHSESYVDAKKVEAPLIHWLPSEDGISTLVIMPDASSTKGFAEDSCRNLKRSDIVQFERFGFIRIDEVGERIIAYYSHR